MKGLLPIFLFGFAVSIGLTQDPPKHFQDQDMPFREIDGKTHDFRPMIQWANEYLFLSDHRPQTFEDGTRIESDVKDWDKRWKRIQKDTAKWEPCLVVGRVARIRRDGVILDCGREWRLLTNYPHQKKLKVDDFIECLALPTGTCDYKTDEGSREIAYIFDHGIAPAESTDAMATAVQVEEPSIEPLSIKAKPVNLEVAEAAPSEAQAKPPTPEAPAEKQPEPAKTAEPAPVQQAANEAPAPEKQPETAAPAPPSPPAQMEAEAAKKTEEVAETKPPAETKTEPPVTPAPEPAAKETEPAVAKAEPAEPATPEPPKTAEAPAPAPKPPPVPPKGRRIPSPPGPFPRQPTCPTA